MFFTVMLSTYDCGIIVSISILLCMLELYLVYTQPRNSNLPLETIAHGLTGVLFWTCCLLNLQTTGLRFRELFLPAVETCIWSAICAILIDVDHFLAAGKFDLQAARNLPGRPFLHWSGGYLIILLILAVLSLRLPSIASQSTIRGLLCLIWFLLIAGCSHLLRDAGLRGLWLWPPPSPRTWCSPSAGQHNYTATPPIPILVLYVLALPTLMLLFHRYCSACNWDIATFSPISSLISTKYRPTFLV